MSRKTQEDLINPQRVFYRLVKDYSDGKLDPKTNFFRAVVVKVGVESGDLEKNPPSPPGSVRARVYTNGLDATTPEFALNIFHPFLPTTVLPAPGEHVLVTFEDPVLKSNGMWIRTLPVKYGQDVAYPDETLAPKSDAANTFEKTSPDNKPQINMSLEYGGGSLTTEQQSVGPDLFSSEEDSFFKDKTILVVGDETISGLAEVEIKSILNLKSPKKIVINSKKKSTIGTWISAVKPLIDSEKPDVVILFLGLNETEKSFTADKLFLLKKEVSSVTNFFFVGPVRLSTIKNPALKQRDEFLDLYVNNNLDSEFSPNYINARELSSDDGRDAQGILFVGNSVKNFLDSVFLRIESRF